jgi:hypothetical protein
MPATASSIRMPFSSRTPINKLETPTSTRDVGAVPGGGSR